MEDDSKHALLQELIPNCNEKLYDLLQMQSNACFDDISGKDSSVRRWPPTVLNMC